MPKEKGKEKIEDSLIQEIIELRKIEELSKEVKLVTVCPRCGQTFESPELFRKHRCEDQILWKADKAQIDYENYELMHPHDE